MMAFKNIEPSTNREWVNGGHKGRWEEHLVDQVDLGDLLDERKGWGELGWLRFGK